MGRLACGWELELVDTEGVEAEVDPNPEKSELYTTCCWSGESIDRLEAELGGGMLDARLEFDAEAGEVRPGWWSCTRN